MRTEFLSFSKPSITEDDISAVNDVLRSGWITTGPKNIEFEQKFCEYVGCPEAIALSSATAGMHLVMKALGIGPGDEVITPSLTWVSTVNIIVLSGATPVFADVDRDNLMVTSHHIEQALSEKTKLIVPVHYAGASANVDPIQKLAEDRKIPLVWDSAHAVGTEYKGNHVGHTGTSIFSFHPTKNMTTGEGGMLCSDNPALVDRIRRFKFHGLGVDAFDRKIQGRIPQAQVLEPGYKYNLTDISAALGIQQLAQLDGSNQKRTELAMKYQEQLTEIDEILPLSIPSYHMKHSWNLFVVRLNNQSGFKRDEFLQKLKEKNIGTGIHFLPVHQQKYYVEFMSSQPIELSNTEWNGDRLFSLPLFPEMTEHDVDDVVETIKEILK